MRPAVGRGGLRQVLLTYWRQDILTSLGDPVTDTAARLRTLAARAAHTHAAISAEVRAQRAAGTSWARIGAALGMTRQSAWERWHRTGTEDAAAVPADRAPATALAAPAPAGPLETAVAATAAEGSAAGDAAAGLLIATGLIPQLTAYIDLGEQGQAWIDWEPLAYADLTGRTRAITRIAASLAGTPVQEPLAALAADLTADDIAAVAAALAAAGTGD